MQATRLTSSTHEEGAPGIHGVTVQRTRRWETTYTAVNWDYPPSLAACYDALLSRGALHSRFLRIAYLSTRETSGTPAPPLPAPSLSPTSTVSPVDTSTAPTSPYITSTTFPAGSHRKPAVRPPPIPPYSVSRPCMNARPRSANPTPHTLKRRKPQWPKPPHYHASLLRSPLSRRKGIFRAVLPPNQAVDFFRWDTRLVSLSVPCRKRDRLKTDGVDPRAPLFVAESVLEPYEAAAGFFGWHGLGLGVIRHVEWNNDGVIDDESCSNGAAEVYFEHDAAGLGNSSLQLEIDEAVVEEGRARWARIAEQLVGPPGLALQCVTEDCGSGKVAMPSISAHKDVIGSRAPSFVSSRREGVRWDPDIGSRPSRPSRSTSATDEMRRLPSSSSKPKPETGSPSAWWCGPSPHHGPPHLPSLCFPPLPSVQYGPAPLQFSPWLLPGRVASAQGHGYWYGAQSPGAPSMSRDSNPAKSLPHHSHVFATPITPTSVHPPQYTWYPIKPNSGRDGYGPGRDCDKEFEIDHGYESTTTTTDSDPPPHTPVGVAISHCIEAFQVNGDDEMPVHGVEINTDHAAASVSIDLPGPITPVKLLGRFSMSTSPSILSGSPGSSRDDYETSKAAVVFPSLDESFLQGSLSQTSSSLSSRGMSAQAMPARAVTPVNSSSSSAKESTTQLGLGLEDNSKMKLKSGDACSVSGDSPAFVLSLCSPLPTSPSPGLRKDSHGFWETVMPVSPSSSLSSFLPLPSEGRMQSGRTVGWISERTGPVPRENFESSEAANSQLSSSVKSRSLSPSPHRIASTGSTPSSSSRPALFSSPTSTPAFTSMFDSSHPSSPPPTNNSPLVPPNPTTLLPAFLATATVKRKKTSRTREIVDRLKSSSIDAGKEGVGLDGLGWLASPGAGEELDGALDKVFSGSDNATGNHVTGSQPSPSPPSKSSSDLASWLGSDWGKNHSQAAGSESCDAGSSGSGGKIHGGTPTAVPDSEAPHPVASAGAATTTGKPNIIPFPILSVSQASASDFIMTHQSQAGSTTGRESMAAISSRGGDGSKMNVIVATSPNTRGSGPQLLPSTPNGSTSPSMHHSHCPLPSPSHPIVHPQPLLAPPPPILAVSPFPHPIFVPFTQYHLAPLHQGQQGQGTWLAVYPGPPPHLSAHPLPAHVHVPPITGVSGMRHASW